MLDLRDPVKLGERLVELHQALVKIHEAEGIARPSLSRTYDLHESELSQIPPYATI